MRPIREKSQSARQSALFGLAASVSAANISYRSVSPSFDFDVNGGDATFVRPLSLRSPAGRTRASAPFLPAARAGARPSGGGTRARFIAVANAFIRPQADPTSRQAMTQRKCTLVIFPN